MASRRKRGPVTFRPRLSAGLALSVQMELTPPMPITPQPLSLSVRFFPQSSRPESKI